jgi:thiol-disulfide isomerase/thioredoxin
MHLMPQSTQSGALHVRTRLRATGALLIALLCLPAASASSVGLVGQPAPDFALRSFGGETLRLSEHLGEVVIINFWTTWCGPCRQEMPLLDEIYTKYRPVGLVLIGVNLDHSMQPAIEMARTLEVSYPVLYDAQKSVGKSYRVSSMPVTVLIDRAGVIRYVSEGYKPGYEARYTEKLRELLNE